MGKPSFKGGVHPPEHKKATEHSDVENLSIPHECFIPLQQHIGKPAVPVVEVGDYVNEGQLIAKADGFISANVHASVPGKVTAIDKFPTSMSEQGVCIVVETQGQFQSEKPSEKIDWQAKSVDELKTIVQEAGITGMGGASFPTHVKLSPPENKAIDTLIINAAECEPYLTVDDVLMRTSYKEIVEGIKISLKILGIKKAIIGIEENKPAAYKALVSYLKSIDADISAKKLKTKYPQGAEKQLIYSLTKRSVPSGGLPMDIGVVVQNVGTVFAMYQAAVENKPLYERLVTVSGSLVNKPGNYKIKIGTTIEHIIKECGGLKEDPAKIIMGGPMCGAALNDTRVPVIKGTSGILFLSKKETSYDSYNPCIRCSRCVSVCPINLLPYEMSNAVELGRYDITEELNPLDCIQCGACSFICPSRRPISHFIKMAQEHVRKKMRR